MKSKYKWGDVGEREYLESTTGKMQYHWSEDGTYLDSSLGIAGSKDKPWNAEVRVNGQWVHVGSYHTGKEAKAAAIVAFECIPKETQ